MPTGRCLYPSHHDSPSAGPPLGLLAAIALGAVVIAFWHQVIVALVVVAILACIAGAVMLLIHNHGSGYDPDLERRANAEQATRQARAAPHSVTDGRRYPPLASPARNELEAAPVVHNHLHVTLPGVTADDVAAVLLRRQRPELEERQPW
jgi:hypothetical protein